MQHFRGSIPAAIAQGVTELQQQDPLLMDLLETEHRRQAGVLSMVAASSTSSFATSVCQAMALGNTTAEGYPGARFHGGCAVLDEIEALAVDRACAAFGARYANVQPHSCSSANQSVIFNLLESGDTLLGLGLDQGGHLSHGASVNITGKFFQCVAYGLTPQGIIDYDQVAWLAEKYRPQMIISGASAYPRSIDFGRFREIADRVGAVLVADISHIAGLVVAGIHQNPMDIAHITTTSTYKQLFGPRGGLILSGRDADCRLAGHKQKLRTRLDRGVFPFLQGTPHPGAMAAKAHALAQVQTQAFTNLASQIQINAQALAHFLMQRGYKVLTGGTDNHMVVLDLRDTHLSGLAAQKALESCKIVVNKNRIPGDDRNAHITSGVRLGTNTLSLRGMGADTMEICSGLLDRVWRAANTSNDVDVTLPAELIHEVTTEVARLCAAYPLPGY